MKNLICGALIMLAVACGDDSGDAPSVYEFESRFVEGESSIAYNGQTFRQVLIHELDAEIAGLTTIVDSTPPGNGQVLDALMFYLDFDGGVSGGEAIDSIRGPTGTSILQGTYGAISSGANLRTKLAGNDTSTDHQIWNTPGSFSGWVEGGVQTPTELVEYWFSRLDALASERIGGPQLDPDGNPVSEVYLTEAGQDYKQLIQKFLLGAITFSQGTDDYLDNDVVDKGLLASNAQDEDKPYSALEHAWDEGFGYFGAARNYGDYTDDEVARKGGRDDFQGANDFTGTNGEPDGLIDLKSEYIFGNASNCAKRDRGSVDTTDFTKDAFDAFLAGRQIIWAAGETLTDDEMVDLVAQRDIVTSTWEKCIAATVVHYINDTLGDMANFDTADYSFNDHAKHWSELKGFALGLQFNPRSPMNTGTRFTDFHNLIGDAPILANDVGGQAAIDQYRADLEAARDLVRDAYGFTDSNAESW